MEQEEKKRERFQEVEKEKVMMDVTQKNQEQYFEISLMRLIGALWHRAWAILLAAVICGAAAFSATEFLITPLYQADVLLYVNNNRNEISSGSVSQADLSASQSLAETYAEILDSRTVMSETVRLAGGDYSERQLRGMLSASVVNETELLRITVTGDDPQDVTRLANTAADVSEEVMENVVDACNVQIVDRAETPQQPSSPDIARNTALGILLGILLSAAVIILLEMTDNVIRSEKNVNAMFGEIPILGAIPRLNMKRTKENERDTSAGNEKSEDGSGKEYLLNENSSFVVREAYRSLQTNVIFSLEAEEGGRIIGVTSSESQEGKSTNAFNLALSMADAGEKVLFLDCDMRLSVTARRTGLNASPGTSNFLTGRASLEECIQMYKNTGLAVITAGNLPPNPVKLLGSSQMGELCRRLRERYDYIIADLPPIGVVSDAAILSKWYDGVILVVRENYSRNNRLRAMISSLEFVGASILGILYFGSEEKRWSRYGKYGKYGSYSEYGEYRRAERREREKEEKGTETEFTP